MLLRFLHRNSLVCEGYFLIEQETKILKLMSEITGRMDMTEFAKKTDLTPNQIVGHMQQLAKEGFLRKVGGGYALTAKAKKVLKASEPVPENLKFQFYVALGQPLNVWAGSIQEFLEVIPTVDAASLEFHVGRDDFENWLRNAVGDADFAEELAKLKSNNPKGEELRAAILAAAQKNNYL
jgi:DNA-binding MarR family transcriptional regulator